MTGAAIPVIMINLDVQSFLEQYDISRKRAEILHTEYEQEMNMLKSIVSSPYYERLYRDDIRFIKAKVNALKLKDYEQNELSICDEVKTIINQIPDIKGQILYERYIAGSIWEQIADKLYYSLGYVQTLHKQALEEIQIILDHKTTTE